MRAVWPYWPIIQEQSRPSQIFAGGKETQSRHGFTAGAGNAAAEFHEKLVRAQRPPNRAKRLLPDRGQCEDLKSGLLLG
jgi:hypothetical protein